MKPILLLSGAALLLAASAAPALAGGPVAMQRPETQASAALRVSSPAIKADGKLPQDQSVYGRNISPPLDWSAGPRGTRAYALIVEDPDAPGPEPTVHWLAWDIPGDARGLPKSIRNVERPKAPAGMVQGTNYHGSLGYSGAHPPVGDPPHHYHFEVFALDRPLRLKPGAGRDDLLKAMNGHVLAKGELVATYAEAPPKPRGK